MITLITLKTLIRRVLADPKVSRRIVLKQGMSPVRKGSFDAARVQLAMQYRVAVRAAGNA
jgi:hypothetical protein